MDIDHKNVIDVKSEPGRDKETGESNKDKSNDQNKIKESKPTCLVAALRKENPSERDCMIFMGILTTQILYERFVEH